MKYTLSNYFLESSCASAANELPSRLKAPIYLYGRCIPEWSLF